METNDIVLAVIGFVTLVVSFLAYRRSVQASREAARSEFQSKKNEVGVMLAELDVAATKRSQQILELTAETQQLVEESQKVGPPELREQMRDRSNALLEHVQQLSRQLESGELTSDTGDLWEQLDAIPAEEAVSSSPRRVDELSVLVQRHKVKSNEWDAEVAAMVSNMREALAKLREAMDTVRRTGL